MARFCGNVGFAISNLTQHSVYEDSIVEHQYYGDVLQLSSRFSSSDKVLDDLSLGNRISIVADAFANEHFHSIKYVVYMGARWEVTNVTVQRPRLILTFGGVYNGPTPDS